MSKPEDLYTTLGVAKTAGQNEIRAAYRRLAKQYHPDLHPGDSSAEEKFKAISAAHSILGDEDKRKRYDRGEIDASGAETPQAGAYRQHAEGPGPHQYYTSSNFGDAADINEIFSDLFGRQSQAGQGRQSSSFSRRGSDLQFTLGVEFLEAARGCTKRLTLPDGQSLDVNIPKGLTDGQTLRLKGKGQPGFGKGGPGDALIAVAVKPHTKFTRQGNDIQIELPITLPEAILGGRVEVPTINGSVTMAIPKGSTSGTTLRLKGKGIETKSARGDQLVRLSIALPDSIDAELTEFMTDWAESHSYNPRAKIKESV
ncbi:MAG: J domain-containing protein [Rhodospirillaceae bacterium]